MISVEDGNYISQTEPGYYKALCKNHNDFYFIFVQYHNKDYGNSEKNYFCVDSTGYAGKMNNATADYLFSSVIRTRTKCLPLQRSYF